jgi:two-component system chemotaxis response regulator CheB
MIAHATNRDIVTIGASAGGVAALLALVAQLPADLPAAVFVVIHMAAGYASQLPELLSARGPLRASHPVDGEQPKVGRIYVAPADNHLLLRPGCMNVLRSAKENGHRPSVDLLFRTASTAYGSRVIGVVLTGHLDCGTAGLLSIKARRGVAVVQDPEEAEAPAMPRSAIRHVAVDHVVRLEQLPDLLVRLTRERPSVAPLHVSAETLELEGEQPGLPAPLVCPTCQGTLTEAQLNGFHGFRCHVGHAFSLSSVVAEQAESVERALWAAARALEESAALTERLAQRSSGSLRARFEDKEFEQRQQVDVLRRLLASRQQLSLVDAVDALGLASAEAPVGE